MREGASAGFVRPPKATKTPVTPSRESETTRKPETAPPRRETIKASPRLRVAALAVRLFDFTATIMPMYPETPEQIAPTRKAMAVRHARSNLLAVLPVVRKKRTAATIMAAKMARRAIVRYWRLRKAIAPL